MAYISIQPSDFFNALLYSGTGASNAVTGVGFQPTITWMKETSGAGNDHNLFDAVRGAGELIRPNGANAESTTSEGVKSFDSDGFTCGTNSSLNGSGSDYASWNWKMGTTSVPSGGSTTPSAVSFNTDAGMGIYKYTGTGSAATIAHGLGAAPDCVITKNLDTGTDYWNVNIFSVLGNDGRLYLNDTSDNSASSAPWNNTAPTSTLIHLGTSGETNSGGQEVVMYAFVNKKGFSRFGRFRGNGAVDGSFVFTGFRPAFLLIKKYSGAGDGWYLVDNKSNPFNRVNKNLFADTTGALSTAGTAASDKNMDFLSNGFKVRSTNGEINQSNEQYVYLAFSEFPFVSSNSKAGVAR